MSKFNKTPFTVSVWDLMHQPGEMREREFDIDVPEKMGEGLVAVQAGSTLAVDARLESLHDGILATVQVDTDATGVCGRCLKDIELPVRVEFAELFAYSLDEAFDYQVEADHVDLEPLIRDAVVLALPFQPVCRPDCPGLDPETGERLEDLPARVPHDEIDSRWSALHQLATSGMLLQTGTETDHEASTDMATDGAIPSASPTEKEKS